MESLGGLSANKPTMLKWRRTWNPCRANERQKSRLTVRISVAQEEK